jgi:hypothetical protein
MFLTRRHDRVTNQLGHFPTILALSAIAKSYRRKIRGRLDLIGDGLAHFEPDPHGFLVWEVLDNMMTRFDLIGGRNLSKVSNKPPEGYGYIEIFNPSNCNDILKILGSNPCLQEILNTNLDSRLDLKGFLCATGDNSCKIVLGIGKEDIWSVIMMWSGFCPEVRVIE